jgi:heme oxygenase
MLMSTNSGREFQGAQQMTLSERLKSSTRPLHDTAEGHNFQRLLANGLLPLADYSAYLEQLFLVHKALEMNIKQYGSNDHRFQRIIDENQLQEPYLKEDLEFLGSNTAAIKALPVTAHFIRKIEESAKNNPASLFGFHYVLLGSKHGGKFIAKNLKQKYGFDGLGTRYFDPYGDTFMQHWRHFVDGLNQAEFSDAEGSDIVEAAKDTFMAVSEVGSALENHLQQPVK